MLWIVRMENGECINPKVFGIFILFNPSSTKPEQCQSIRIRNTVAKSINLIKIKFCVKQSVL